jgi:hypothetical protein
LVAALVILGGVVLAALGRVGEMATFAGDTPPMDLDEVSATDVALLRPPMSLWGYNAQATEDALRMIARSVTARDVEIASLHRELADLRRNASGARTTGIAGAQATRAGDIQAARAGGVEVARAGGVEAARAGDRPVGATGPASPPGAPGQPRPAGAPAGEAGGAPAPDAAATAAAAAPAATKAGASQAADPGAETQPARQPPRAEPAGPADPGQTADPPTEDDWLPLWQRSSEPGPDE